jgi:hypothetical protein
VPVYSRSLIPLASLVLITIAAPASPVLAQSWFERLFSPGAVQAPPESAPAQGADEPAEPPHPRTAKRPAPPKLSSASKPKSEQKPAQLTTQPAAAAVPASAFASGAPGPQDGSTASSPAKAPEPDRLYTCDTEASGKDLRGYARGLFISECLSKGTPGTAEDKPKGAEMIAAKPMAGASNVEQGQATKPTADASRSAQVQDEQFRRWSRAAERATRSICVGCGI